MGQATIGFPNGPGIQFRIDPQAINWDFRILTSVQNTVGGRVVQVIGAVLSDITISGLFGEDLSQAKKVAGAGLEHGGRSWRLARRFATKIREMEEYQGRDSNQHNLMAVPAVFSYPPRDWRFRVYIKDLSDPDGGAVTMTTPKFSHGYTLTLFVVQEGSDTLTQAGTRNGVLNQAKQRAISQYISRISDGIGWEPTKYNGNFLDYYGGQGLGDYGGRITVPSADEHRSPQGD